MYSYTYINVQIGKVLDRNRSLEIHSFIRETLEKVDRNKWGLRRTINAHLNFKMSHYQAENFLPYPRIFEVRLIFLFYIQFLNWTSEKVFFC